MLSGGRLGAKQRQDGQQRERFRRRLVKGQDTDELVSGGVILLAVDQTFREQQARGNVSLVERERFFHGREHLLSVALGKGFRKPGPKIGIFRKCFERVLERAGRELIVVFSQGQAARCCEGVARKG